MRLFYYFTLFDPLLEKSNQITLYNDLDAKREKYWNQHHKRIGKTNLSLILNS